MSNPFFTTKTITIACRGADEVDVDSLQELQGNLKTRTKEGYEWQKKSILDLGFSFAMAIWVDPDGKKWEIDGHRRLRTLKQMRDEGYTIPKIPVYYVYADDVVQAKKKILANVSQPESITDEGFEEFINEEGAEIIEDEAEDILFLGEDDEINEEPAPTKDDKPKKEKEPKCEKCINFHERNHDETPETTLP